jgi:quercetin dioxygenase-like cupin family protein
MKRAANQPVGELRIYGGIYLKTWTVEDAGTLIPQHSHRYDHLSMIVSGAVRAWQDDVLLGDYTAPQTIRIPAQTTHTFLTLTPDVVIACIHAVGEAEDVEIAAEHQFDLED